MMRTEPIVSPPSRRPRRVSRTPGRRAGAPLGAPSVPAVQPHLTVADLAMRWQKHPDFLRRAILGQPAPDGIPEAFKVGSGPKAPWLIPLAAVEAYEQRHRVVRAAPPADAAGTEGS